MAPFALHRDATTSHSHNSTSSPTSSSDKENRRHNSDKRAYPVMVPSRLNKRPRLADRDSNSQSQAPPPSQRNGDTRYYDPDQDADERRRVRRELRDLNRELNDSRGEFMQSGNDGIYKTVEKANEIFVQVKQTSDATIDSRLLVNAADLSHKKTAQLALGDASAGIDVDEFVSKCISFMHHGPTNTSDAPRGTQGRRGRPRQSQRDPYGSDEDEGDAMNWEYLGQAACFPHNARPVVAGWLLGPLSVQKRARQMTQRTAREAIDPENAVKPVELQQGDLGQQDSVNLTTTCSHINKLLSETQRKRERKAEQMLENAEDPTPEQVQEVFDECGIADDGGIPLFAFCINPHSFGQSVENLFYVSFLVRDGTVGVSTDSRQLPTLHHSNPYAPSEAQRQGIQKHQAVFSLDYETWEQLITVFNIKEPIIPHREEIEEETGMSWV
ncbi:uncharacterized protein N7511_000661 [Penicillium nucicola]|uniref:uncharacterized protein n=1 Tax=Penicillium nucicola TaxID=1850975 RepID=UPI002544DFC4|nr:uncharacterized protein N7511_000661 [Penicillium nucicola]KAJ5775650.1 hypothetical protein N7511_000661 [Penicillium nucicola]